MGVHISNAFIGSDYSEVQINSGSIEVSEMIHTIASETGSSDTLAGITINAASLASMGGRHFLFILHAKVGHTITITPSSSLKTSDGNSFDMTDTKPALFFYDVISSQSQAIGLFNVPGGTLVDLNSPQTLVNKNLTEPIINAPDLNEKITSYASGAINVFYGIALLTGGSPVTYTLADPLAGADDGQILRIMSTTAQAHKVDASAGSGFNGGGATVDFANFGGAIGDNIELLAYNGDWYVINTRNVTIAAT